MFSTSPWVGQPKGGRTRVHADYIEAFTYKDLMSESRLKVGGRKSGVSTARYFQGHLEAKK